MSELTELSIADAHRRLVRRKISSLELTEATIRQIERTEPLLCAYATLMAEQALDDARRADHEIGCDISRGPLHGIPVGVKDLCCTRDAVTEAGSGVLRGYKPSFDATVISRLRQGGAVILGKTVTSEFAFGPTLRPTRNAWHQDFTPSGSSAGSAVAVAARSAFGAIGTDTLGSIRVPAGVNGVVGLKPTFGLVSKWGVIPMSASLDHVGPITRTVYDCAAMLSVIAGFDARDPYSLPLGSCTFRVPDTERLDGVRLGIERTYLLDPRADPAATAAAETAATVLDELGAAIVEVDIPESDIADAAALTISIVDASTYHLPRLRRHGSKYAPPTRVFIETGALVPGTDYVRAQQARSLVRRSLREAFDRYRLDALIAPGWGPPGRATDGADPFDWRLRPSTVNLAGMPAINVPCGFTTDGLPLGGFELHGRPLGEGMLFRIAAAYERVNRWHKTRPPVEHRRRVGQHLRSV